MYRYFLKDFTREGERLTIHRSVYIEGYLPVHDHDFLEIFYVEDGCGYHFLNGNRTELKKGDLVFLSYHSSHTFEALDDSFRWINIDFYSDFIDGSLINEYNSSEIIKLSVFKSMFDDENGVSATDIVIQNAQEEFETLILEMEREYNAKKYGYVQILKNYLLAVLTKIFRNTMQREYRDQNRLNNDNLIELVMEELDRNIDSEVNLQVLAQKAYLSPKYLSRVFKQHVGISFKEFIQQKRIDKACEFLASTDLSITDVMINIGYSDPKSFYKIFKRFKNMTPSEYRRQFKS